MIPEHGRKPVVLIVDDTPANLGVIFNLLGDAGFELLFAEDGESAIQRATYARPDLVLLDVLMPDLDGFATCQLLKAQEATRDIPVIFMSALTDTVDKIRGFEVGAVDYVTKPFQPEELLARVRTHLALEHLKRRLRESEERLSRIFDSAMDAIVTLDGAGRITLMNRAAETVFRVRSAGAIGQPLARYASEGLRDALAGHMGQTGELPQAAWLPEGLTARRADGEEFPIEATLSRSEAGGQTLWTLILRDIDARRKAEAEASRLRGVALYLEEEVRAAYGADALVGSSKALTQVLQGADRVAETDATVLVTGETGTGKELVARAIHTRSRRRGRILVKVNCAAIPLALVESELFGHEKGAFTGAVSRKAGRFELADGGTLFLDEIAELPPDLQPKLLRVLQEGEFERVGGTRTLRVDVRVIAATNRDLEEAVRQGRFRTDLFYRLNVFPLHLPPLRDRVEDIPLLVAHFVRKHASRLGRRIERVPERVMAALTTYHWSGNVRELEHVIERAVIVTDGPDLAYPDWLRRSASAPVTGRVATLDEAERAHILDVLERTAWRVSGEGGAAQLLGLPATTLESRMKRLGIVRKRAPG
jgi:PAS domain S-box-containing protein